MRISGIIPHEDAARQAKNRKFGLKLSEQRQIGRWVATEANGGIVSIEADGYRLYVPTARGRYVNAQLTDYAYQGERRFTFEAQPPLRLTVHAHSPEPGALRGTAGFGFWNHPLSPDIQRFPRLPRALWFFFAAPPNDMQLARGVPGSGWKAATIDASRPRALVLAPLALPAMLLFRSRHLYNAFYPVVQRALGIAEMPLDVNLLATPRTYTLDWQKEQVTFAVDGDTILHTDNAPRGPLGFVAWVDNQYAVVTPRGNFRFGIVETGQPQTLVLEQVTIERGE